VPTYLDRIIAEHRARAATDQRRLDDLLDAAADLPACRDMASSLTTGDRLAVISEIKRRSPSKGDLFADLDPAALARAYDRAGAAALSVLTDRQNFGGSPDDLALARGAVPLAVLRKDFTVSAHDVVDARLMGADAVLLIVAALDDAELADFADLAAEIGLAALVETHDEDEVERALTHAAAAIIGVNQRDLVTFSVDRTRAVRVAASIPDGVIAVAESGVDGPEAATELAAAGFAAILVGEHLVTATDPGAALDALRVPRPPA
jgi:indole-3-glycerol phosphate synthase